MYKNFNPVALGKAKIVYNFGLSECNGVDKKKRKEENVAVVDLIMNLIKHCQMSSVLNELMDGWMTCDFTSFLTVFQSYQDDVWMIMIGCVQWNSVYG